MTPFASLRRLVARIRHSWELHRYNPYTIAEYFRRQGMAVGEGCMIVPTLLGTEPYLVKIGNHVTIAQGVTLVTHDGGSWLFRHEVPDLQGFGPIIIEDNCVIGVNAVLFPHVTVGRNSIVGAGSVVIADVPPETIVMGVPARPFGSLSKYREKCLERWQQQRPPSCQIEPGASWWTSRNFPENRQQLRTHLRALFRTELK